MAEFIKDLKIKNGVTNKVLSVDNNGNIVSTDKTVNELVTNDTTDALAERISSLETTTTTMGQRLQDINGEK